MSTTKEKLVIFDTTLRDGEQSPGASMTKEEKVRIARMLERMRVDVIEAGFAIASPGDFEAVQAVAEAVTEARICSLARAVNADIVRAGEALKKPMPPASTHLSPPPRSICNISCRWTLRMYCNRRSKR